MLLFWEEAFSAHVPHLGGIQASEVPAQKEVIPRGWFAFIHKENTLKMLQVQTCKRASWCAKCVKLCPSLCLCSPPRGALPGFPGGLAGVMMGRSREQLGPSWPQWWPGSGWAPYLACVSIWFISAAHERETNKTKTNHTHTYNQNKQNQTQTETPWLPSLSPNLGPLCG